MSPSLHLPPVLDAALAHVWASVAEPGTSLTGDERVGLVAEARRARAGLSATSEAVAVEVARRIAARPASVRREWVDRTVESGLGFARYVEIVGLVSRAVAADTVTDALGLDRAALPDPIGGEPTRETASDARPSAGWVPMVGATSITLALSLVPAENRALEEYHGAAYLTFSEMADPAIERGLTRPQMELVASRTSALNECFY